MSQRKLQQEIDKVLKKVKEGLEIFDGYYEKLQSCESQSQKEKLEGDLKREIKKLQRLRDQIKSWLSGNEVKDKKALLENRKLIENAMERFKTVEKDMKTKAFSKEGLSMERVDPRQKEKNVTSDFLHQMLEELERQSEKHEATIDQIQGSSKRGKKLDSHKQTEISELQEKIDRNHWHQEKLEQILRFLANDDLECEQVNNIQEDIRYYVESNEDADFADDDGIYDELGLEDAEEAYGNIGDFPHVQDETQEEIAQATTPTPVSTTPSAPPSKKSSISNQGGVISSQIAAKGTVNGLPAVQPSVLKTNMIKPIATSGVSSATGTPVLTPASLKPSTVQKPELKYNSVAAASVNSASSTPILPNATLSNTVLSNTTLSNTTLGNTTLTNNTTVPSAPPGLNKLTTATSTVVEGSVSDSSTTNKSRDNSQSPLLITNAIKELIPAFENAKTRISKPQPIDEISKILETSLLNCPDSLDAEKPKNYTPKTPHPTSIYYPQDPLPELNYSSIVSKLDLSTLFYNFYYVQDEYIQILSARELVRKSWLFDKISHKWFQKTEETQPPQVVNDQVVSPERKIAWKYFDYEGVWLPRRSDDFNIDSVQLEASF